jgi:hypothetical protein
MVRTTTGGPRTATTTSLPALLNRSQRRLAAWASHSSDAQLSKRLLRFVPTNEAFSQLLTKAGTSRAEYVRLLLEPRTVRSRISAVNRGACLVFNAATWTKPIVGRSKPLAAVRGMQWRTTMAWIGLELMLDAVFPKMKKLEADAAWELCQTLNLGHIDDPIPVPDPIKRSRSPRNLWEEEVSILDYLRVRGGKPRKTLDNWWINRVPIEDYPTALQAARAIRDVTAHGLLSARTAQKIGLNPRSRSGKPNPLAQLVSVTTTVAIAILDHILKPGAPPSNTDQPEPASQPATPAFLTMPTLSNSPRGEETLP